MPALIRDYPSSGSSEHSFNDSGTPGNSQDADGFEYPAMSFPGYSEKPLSEQLEPIAVVGMGCRLPGDVSSPAEFWDMMINKKTGQTPKVPSSRFNIDAHFHQNNERPGSFNVLGGYFLNSGLQEFDPVMFGITPIEAMWMDPQQRKLLEVVYETFESGGVTLESIAGTKTACFIGNFTADYQQMAFKEPWFRHSYAATGVDPGIVSNRISHVFNLNGPSICVNTACSSSVYAIHNACNALRNKECTGAVVGGTNLVLTVDQHMNTAKLGVLSPDSTCHTFDASANGYGRADGVGAVYLKRLSDAIRDGDPIRGVVRSSAVNSNGKVPAVGITHPNLAGQEAVIRHAYHRGGDLDPRLTGYFECHGTGTAVGDPLEVHAVANALNENRLPGEEPLWIGAVKTNIGHSEAASGLSALIKAILTVEKGIIPPTRGLVKPSPAIDWEGWKVKVVTEPTPFPSHLPVKRVSVNSFGYGGTNAHMIIESADSFLPFGPTYLDNRTKAKAPRGAFNRKRAFLLPFSAHDKATLKRNIAATGIAAEQYDLLDLSYTLANRRSRFSSRGYAVTSYASLEGTFKNIAETFAFADKKRRPTLGFAFTGQGAQWARMGSELMTYYPSFLRSIRVLDRALEDLPDGPDWTLEDALLEDAQTSRVHEAEFSQPLCTAIQVATVQLLNLWGIKPVVTVGHSSGEIAAAFAAGLISATGAIIAAYYRGKVVSKVNTNGAMMAVGLGAEGVAPFLEDADGKVVIACHNSPASVTLSGDAEALQSVKDKLDAEKVFARLVKTGGKAYHSHHMKPVAERYEALMRNAKASAPLDPLPQSDAVMVSSVIKNSSISTSLITDDIPIDEKYWSANLRSPVLFNQAVQTIASDSRFSAVDLLIEIGPHSALSGPIRQICTANGFDKLGYLPTLLRGEDCASSLLKLAGELFLRDYPLDMERITLIEEPLPSGKIHLAKGSLLVDLPIYQWNYGPRNLWAEVRHSKEHRAPTHARHDVLGGSLTGGSLAEPSWRNKLRIRDLPWLKDHSLGGEAVFPAAGYFSMAIEAITQLNDISPHPVKIESYVMRDISIKAALVTPDDDDGIEVIFNMRPSVNNDVGSLNGSWDFSVSSISEDGHRNDHIAGSISINTRPRGQAPKKIPNLPQRASGKAWNQKLREVGFDYGPTFQDMADIRSDGKNYAAACKTVLKQECGIMEGESRYVLHPGCVDSCLQLLIVAIYAGRLNDMTSGAVPIQVDEVAIWTPTAEQLKDGSATAFSWVPERGIRSYVGASQLVAANGGLLMDISDMRTTAYEAAVPLRIEEPMKEQPYGEMVWKYDIDSLKPSKQLDSMNILELVDLAIHKNPALKVVEIGSTHTKAILSSSELLNYTVATPNEESVEEILTSLKGYKNANALKFDPAMEIETQDMPFGSFDLAVAPGSADDLASLKHIRSLVKAGGHAIFELGAHPSTSIFEEANLSVDLLIQGPGTPSLALTTAINDAPNGVVNGVNHEIVLVYRKSPAVILTQVEKAFQNAGWKTATTSLEAFQGNAGDHVIMLADFEGPLLATLQAKELEAIQNLTGTASSLLWVSPGGLLSGKKPEYAMASGLARSITSESVSIDFTTLDFDLDNTSEANVADIILTIGQRQKAHTEARETEYCVSKGLVYISRLVANDSINNVYAFDKEEAKATLLTPDMRVVGKVQSGKVVFEVDERSEQPLAEDSVEVKVSVCGLSKEGTLVINGSDYPTTFSHELGGVVERVGSAVTDLKVGDEVAGFGFDKFATHQRVPAYLLQKLQKGDVLNEVVSLPMAYGAALYGLKNLANLQAQETVLILGGTSSAGIAAIKVAQSMNAIPYVTITTENESERLKRDFGLKDSQLLRPSELSVPSQLAAASGGSNADVVFSSGFTDATTARECWRYIAAFGRFVDSGRKNVLKRSAVETVPLHRGANYLSFDMLDVYEWKPQILGDLLRLTMSLYRQQSISPLRPSTEVNIADIDSAVASFSDDFASGKTLISYKASEIPLQLLPSRPSLKFRADATYLLVGCLGGLGRSLTSWMMKKGARRFAFLSRSGTDSEQAAILVKDIEAAGIAVQVIRGDATVKADVERAVKGIPAEAPIRGVVQAAMVLRDGLFQNMPYSSWVTSTRPKVQGTMNLHSALQHTPLDFFVTTSSTSGTLGTPGQSNYAAGNAFLDSLSRHRLANSQPSASLILPMVLGVGYVAEHPEVEEALKRKGVYGIDEEHLLESFEVSMAIQEQKKSADHVVIGMDPSKLQKSLNEAATTDGFWMDDVRFSHLMHAMKSVGASSSGGSGQSILATIKSSASAADAVLAASDHFVEKLSRLLMVPLDEFEPDVKAIADYGLDSMIGAELRNWIFKEFALDIPFQQLLGPGLTVTKFAEQVCANQGIVVEAAAA